MAKKSNIDTNKVLNFSIFLAVVVILLICLAFVIYMINIPTPDTKVPEPDAPEQQPEDSQGEEPTGSIIVYTI